MTSNEDLTPAKEWVKASAYVTILLAELAAGNPVDPDELQRARISETSALSRYIADTAVAVARGAGLPDDMYGTDALTSEVENFLREHDEDEGPL